MKLLSVAFVVAAFAVVSWAAPTELVNEPQLTKELRCLVAIINEECTKSNLEEVWTGTKQDIDRHLKTLDACKEQSCVEEETAQIAFLVIPFLHNLEKRHPELRAEIGRRQGKECEAGNGNRSYLSVESVGDRARF